MKKICFSVLLVIVFSVNVSATDFGIGVSVKSYDSAIYIPITISPAFRIEASVRYSESEDKRDDYKYERSSYEFGIGAFGTSKPRDFIVLYYGARLAYINGEYENSNNYYYLGSPGRDEEFDGYRISPILGFEYFIIKNFSIGGEVELYFLKTEGEIVDDGVKVDIEENANGTYTRAILRYYF